MISAVDTNILLDLARPNPEFVDNAIDLLDAASSEGAIVISPIVRAEMSAHFKTEAMLDRFLAKLEISVDQLDDTATWKAGQTWLQYRKGGGKRDRIITDFLIGAHAAHQTGRLLTRDRGFYRSYFPELKVVESPDQLYQSSIHTIDNPVSAPVLVPNRSVSMPRRWSMLT
ncbi:MAG: putative nucleic acid-binding protein [Verrucomicrobiales bacterium]|jgi:predicted nucleic acid-binding protein